MSVRKKRNEKQINKSRVIAAVLLVLIIGGLIFILTKDKSDVNTKDTGDVKTQVKEVVTEAPEEEPQIDVEEEPSTSNSETSYDSKPEVSREEIKKNDSKLLEKQAESFTKTKEENFKIAEKLLKDKYGNSAFLEDDLSDSVFIGRNGMDYYKIDAKTKEITTYDTNSGV